MGLTQNITDAYQEQKGKLDNYGGLSAKIWRFNDIQGELKTGWEILQTVKAGGNKELYTKFEKEYKELYDTVRVAFESEKSFSKEEREKIKQELADIVIMADREGIDRKKSFFSRTGDILRQNSNEVLGKTLDSEWSLNEVLIGLNESKDMYSGLSDDVVDKLKNKLGKTNSNISKLEDIKTKREMHLFQEKLIEKALGTGNKGFDSNGYLHVFSQTRGNYLSTDKHMESLIKTVDLKTIGGRGIKNYISYLESKGKLNKETLETNLGKEKALDVINYIETQKDKEELKGFSLMKKLTDIAIELKNTAVNLIQKAKEFVNGIINSKSPKEFEEKIKGISQLNEEEKTQVIKTLEAELANANSELRKMLMSALEKSEKGKKLSPEKKESEINTLIETIKTNLKPTTLNKAYEAIGAFNALYGAKVDAKVLTQKVANSAAIGAIITGAQAGIEYENARKNGDKEGMEKAQKKKDKALQEHNGIRSAGIINDKLTKQQVEDLSQKKGPSLASIVEDIRKQDKSFDAELRVLEKYEKAYYKKYPEEKPKPETINDKKQINETANETQTNENSFSYANGTTISYAEVSGGYGVKTNHGVIEMNYSELQTVKKSEKALENMIHFKDTLDELNLGGLWKYRESIFQGIANKYTLAFNTKDDYLNKNELKIFLTAVLKSIGSPANNVNNFENLKSEIKAINYGGILSGQKDVNKSGDSLIESIFIQKFDPKRTGIFELNAFQESISNLFGKSV